MPPGSQAPFSPSWMVAATQATISPLRKIGMIIDWSVLWTLPNRASLWMKPSPSLTPTVGSSFQYFMMYRIGWCRIAENAITPWQDRYDDVAGGRVDRGGQVAPFRSRRGAHAPRTSRSPRRAAPAIRLRTRSTVDPVDALGDAGVLVDRALGDAVRTHDLRIRSQEQRRLVHELVDPLLLLTRQRPWGPFSIVVMSSLLDFCGPVSPAGTTRRPGGWAPGAIRARRGTWCFRW